MGGQPTGSIHHHIRVQEPGWGVRAGVGVAFEFDTDADRERVKRFVAEHPDPAPEREQLTA